MIYPSADKLESWGSKYSLVVLAAKRAKQIKSGAPPLIPTSSKNPLTIALEEIAAGVILCQVADHDILPKTSQETEVAQLLAIPTVPADEDEVEIREDEQESVVQDDDLLELPEDKDEVETEDYTEEASEVAEPAPEVETVEIEAEPAKPKRTRKKKEQPEAAEAAEETEAALAEE
jgi:DNA-directed RNA polymerase subunit omega